MRSRTYERELPSAISCFLDDVAACTANLLERLFGEERRRSKVIPHAFGERAVLKLMFAAVLRPSESWRGNKDYGIRVAAARVSAGPTEREVLGSTRASRAIDETRVPLTNFQQREDLTPPRSGRVVLSVPRSDFGLMYQGNAHLCYRHSGIEETSRTLVRSRVRHWCSHRPGARPGRSAHV